MNGKRRGLSLGSILTICLTAVVTVGCIWLFGRIQGPNPEARMSAQRMRGLVQDALNGATATPDLPQATVRTVTVTMAPTLPPTAPPAATLAPQRPTGQRYSFSMTFAGLMAFQSDISDSVYDKTTKTLDYRPVVSLLSGKVNADLSFVSLPQIINRTDQKYGDALVPAAAAEAIRALGFDDVILANEHILNQGAQGASDTAGALLASGLSCGGVTAGGAQQNRMVQLNGARIAVLSYTDALTAKSKNALSAQPALLSPFDAEQAAREIRAARAQGAQCVIVNVYWGRTDTVQVTSSMRTAAKALAEAGADLILGTRPSRVLPVEILSGIREDGSAYDCLVAYSLGTLLTESREGYDISGILLHVNMTVDERGRLHFNSVEYTPTYIWRQTVGGSLQYRIVCSADPAPEGMSDRQKDVMKNALKRIQNTLQSSPVNCR